MIAETKMLAALLNGDKEAKKLAVEVSLKKTLFYYRAHFYSDYIFDCKKIQNY